jgi:arylsulfatase A-like enzyme/Flp pilus assembly protein TadD
MARAGWFARVAGLAAVILFSHALLAGSVATAGNGAAAQKHAATARYPSIVLITLDTTRADRMGFLGSKRGLTPNLDRLAEQSAVFARAYAQAPLTSVSHATVLTGTYPQFHGVIDFPMPLGNDVPYAPEILKAHGYRTAAFVASLALDPAGGAPGFDRGFDVYDANFRPQDLPKLGRYQSIVRRGEEVVNRADAWLDKHAGSPFFLWVHLYDAHDPYEPPEPYRTRYASEPYDGGIAYDDMVVGKLLQHLKSRGLYERALLMITADHGESLGAHGEDTHSVFLYDETIHVPLIVKLPNDHAAMRLENRVELTDLLPTLLQVAGLAVPKEVQGRSLLELISQGKEEKGPGQNWPDFAYAQADYANIAYGWAKLQSWRSGKYLYIQAPHRELYDQTEDPLSLHNLAETSPAVTDTIAGKLKLFRDSTSSTRQQSAAAMDPAKAKELAALGYVAAGGDAETPNPSEPEVDPKEHIKTVNLSNKSRVLLEEEHFQEAVPILQELIAENPEVVILYFKLGGCFLELKEYKEAIPVLRKAVELDPNFTKAEFNLGRALMATKDYDGAATVFENLSIKAPKALEPHLLLEVAYLRAGHFPEVIKECEKVLAFNPEQYDTHVVYARALMGMGQLEEAESKLEKAASLRPDRAEPHILLSEVYNKRGREADAEQEREKAVSLGATPNFRGVFAPESSTGDREK